MDCEKAKDRISEHGRKCIPYIDPENHYIKSYPYLLRATELLCKEMGADSAIVVSHIAYGWMRRILNYHFSKHDEKMLHNAQNVTSFEAAQNMIEKIDSSPVDNSWIGLSKVLHFTNPQFFPIWDNNVAANFYEKTENQVKKRQNYIDYISFIQSQLDRNIVFDFQNEFKNRAKYKVSKVRACEFILYSISKHILPK